MKITINWLREFLDTSLTSKEIIDNLNILGFELKKEYSQQTLWKSLEIVKIIEKKTHPNADKLNLYTIQKKSGDTLTIVCGDPFLNIGNCVPYAMPGTTMPSGLILSVATIRGVESPGMLCSASEIDLPIKSSNVLHCFHEDWGKSIAEAYEAESIFEIELTPNRGDALSIQGIARILANADLGTFIEKTYKDYLLSEETFFKIKSEDCLALNCTLFKHNIESTPPSIVKKLQLTDHNVTNLDVVDLTNYISHSLGQPMHVFDYDKIKNDPCSITKLEEDQDFETLANQIISLSAGTLVFKSGSSIISWPSTIGGNNSKVDQYTTTILLETGVFKCDSIQRRKHGIYTSAAKKAEYGIDPFCLQKTSNAFFSFLNVTPISQQYVPFEEEKKIPFNFNKVKEILGSDISLSDFTSIMKKKGFVFHSNGTVSPPSYKFFDISTENCIVEEFAIGRYDNMESINLTPKYTNTNTIKNNCNLTSIALFCGFNECKNISLSKKEHDDFKISLLNRNVLNFSNQNYSILRGSLIPDLLKNVSWHINNQQKIYNFFEYGLIYGDFPNKQRLVFTAIAKNYTDLQILLSKILADRLIDRKIYSKTEEISYSTNSTVFYLNETKIAIISCLNPSILKNFNIKEYFSLELFPEELNKDNSITLNAPCEYAPIYQDVTFKLKAEMPASIITNFLNKQKLDYTIISSYPSDNLNIERNITIQFKLSPLKAITKEEINKIMEEISSSVRVLLI